MRRTTTPCFGSVRGFVATVDSSPFEGWSAAPAPLLRRGLRRCAQGLLPPPATRSAHRSRTPSGASTGAPDAQSGHFLRSLTSRRSSRRPDQPTERPEGGRQADVDANGASHPKVISIQVRVVRRVNEPVEDGCRHHDGGKQGDSRPRSCSNDPEARRGERTDSHCQNQDFYI
jgi:hypothetical protein